MSRSLLFALALLVPASSALRLQTTRLPSLRSGRPVAQTRDDGPKTAAQKEEAAANPNAGKGFGAPPRQMTDEENTAMVSRGQKALEEMRAQQGEESWRKKEPEMYIPTKEEKDTLAYGFAGFLILAGFLSLIFGGSLWEAKEAAPTTESANLFGYAPTRPEADAPAPTQ